MTSRAEHVTAFRWSVALAAVVATCASAFAQGRSSSEERDRRASTPTFDIVALVNTFELQTLSKMIGVQGTVSHTECKPGRITARIERQCFPPLHRPDATLFSVQTPPPLRNPFSSEESTCFTAVGGRITNIAQNCFEAEVTIRQCEPRQPEECSWSLRNGTSYVAQVVGQRDARPQVGADFKTWRTVGRGVYEFALPEHGTLAEPEYSYAVTVTNTITGKSVELSRETPSREGIETEFDPRWRKLTVRIR